ncbi:hypothetical protein K439DRAFT_1661562 [Ramaria rubella]|nr:hypothetical protein K439DRAFT_1661562 [Ramaria rubella]
MSTAFRFPSDPSFIVQLLSGRLPVAQKISLSEGLYLVDSSKPRNLSLTSLPFPLLPVSVSSFTPPEQCFSLPVESCSGISAHHLSRTGLTPVSSMSEASSFKFSSSSSPPPHGLDSRLIEIPSSTDTSFASSSSSNHNPISTFLSEPSPPSNELSNFSYEHITPPAYGFADVDPIPHPPWGDLPYANQGSFAFAGDPCKSPFVSTQRVLCSQDLSLLTSPYVYPGAADMSTPFVEPSTVTHEAGASVARRKKSKRPGMQSVRCEICPGYPGFASKNSLQKHSRTVHSTSHETRCDVCETIFSRPDSYKRHLTEEGQCSNPQKRGKKRGPKRILILPP